MKIYQWGSFGLEGIQAWLTKSLLTALLEEIEVDEEQFSHRSKWYHLDVGDQSDHSLTIRLEVMVNSKLVICEVLQEAK